LGGEKKRRGTVQGEGESTTGEGQKVSGLVEPFSTKLEGRLKRGRKNVLRL